MGKVEDLKEKMIQASRETEEEFASQEWQFNPSFQKVSEIKEVEDGNQPIQQIKSNDHSDAESQ